MKKIILLIFVIFGTLLYGDNNISMDFLESLEDSVNRDKISKTVEIKQEIVQDNNISKYYEYKMQKARIEARENSMQTAMIYRIFLVFILSITALTLLWITVKYLKVDNSDNASRIGGIIVILFILGFIVIIVEDASQMSSIVGLLGAIAGYFLKESKELLDNNI